MSQYTEQLDRFTAAYCYGSISTENNDIGLVGREAVRFLGLAPLNWSLATTSWPATSLDDWNESATNIFIKLFSN